VLTAPGGGSGIGLATVKLFESKNATGIVIADFRKPSAEILKSLSANTTFVQTDVSSWESLSHVFRATMEKYGRLDYVYANAGIGELDHLFVDKFKEGSDELQAPNYAAIEVKSVSNFRIA